jgi:DNA polymerase-3 subunit beta
MIISQSLLVDVARRLRKVASPSAKMPVLSYVRCTRNATGTHLVATDQDRFLTISIPSEVGTSELSRKLAALSLAREQADFLVPIDTLTQVAKASDKGTSIKIEPGGLSYVTGGIAAYTAVETEVSMDSFPVIPTLTWPTTTLDADPFHKAVSEGISHASNDATRYVLNGMLYSAKGEAVAADGRRLYLREGLPAIKADAIIPNETCKMVEEGMTICFNKVDKDETRFVRFTKVGSLIVRLTSKLVDGQFPNFRQVIPDEGAVKCVIRVDAAELASTIRKANVANTKEKSLRLDISPGQLSLKGKRGSFNVAADTKGDIGDGRTGYNPYICFNQDFVADALDAGLGRLSLIDSLSPGVFTSPAKMGVKVILMPMRVSVEDPTPATK